MFGFWNKPYGAAGQTSETPTQNTQRIAQSAVLPAAYRKCQFASVLWEKKTKKVRPSAHYLCIRLWRMQKPTPGGLKPYGRRNAWEVRLDWGHLGVRGQRWSAVRLHLICYETRGLCLESAQLASLSWQANASWTISKRIRQLCGDTPTDTDAHKHGECMEGLFRFQLLITWGGFTGSHMEGGVDSGETVWSSTRASDRKQTRGRLISIASPT